MRENNSESLFEDVMNRGFPPGFMWGSRIGFVLILRDLECDGLVLVFFFVEMRSRKKVNEGVQLKTKIHTYTTVTVLVVVALELLRYLR